MQSYSFSSFTNISVENVGCQLKSVSGKIWNLIESFYSKFYLNEKEDIHNQVLNAWNKDLKNNLKQFYYLSLFHNF